jgi:uncharacterized protein (DUF1501 family)
MKRRTFLKVAAALPALSFAGRLYAVPRAGARLLIVFLRGAYDAANVVVPISSDFYYEARPNLAIARPGTDPNSALSLNADWGLHPALADTIYPLFKSGQIAFIPFAGTDDASRSHFETQDTIELGQPLSGTRNYESGFLSRLVTALAHPKPIAFSSQLPLSFRGGPAVPNIALNFAGKPGIGERDAALIEAMYRQSELAPAVNEGFAVQKQVYQTISNEMQAANRNAVTPKGFELAAERIGVLMRDQFNLGFVDVGGWDTHVNEGGADGYLAARLRELGRALASLPVQLGNGWNDTVVVVISEFGRTFRENGDRGTDHGHGTVYWVLGGNIKGGQIAGDQVAVSQNSLFQNRDYPVLNEYRAIFAGLFKKMYGLDGTRIAAVFPSTTPKPLSLI